MVALELEVLHATVRNLFVANQGNLLHKQAAATIALAYIVTQSTFQSQSEVRPGAQRQQGHQEEEVHAKSPGLEEWELDARAIHGQIEPQHVVHGANRLAALRIDQMAESCDLERMRPSFLPSQASGAT